MENNRSRESIVEIETSLAAPSSIGTHNSSCKSVARQGRRRQRQQKHNQQRQQRQRQHRYYYCHSILLALPLFFSNYNCCYYAYSLLPNNMSIRRIVSTPITTRTTGLLSSSGRHCCRLSVGVPLLNAFVRPSSFRRRRMHHQRQQVQQRFLSSTANNNSDITIETRSNVGGGAVSMNEINLSLADGTNLKGQHYSYKQPHQTVGDDDDKKGKATTKIKILALHGWLDNCRSFHYLAPHLTEKFGGEAEFVGIDLPGHGWSSHRPIDGPSTVLSEGVYYVAETLHALGWDDNDNGSNNNDDEDSSNNVTLIGHSMGGGIATTYAGVFPNQISNLISIDMIGSEPGLPENTASTIRNHVTQRRLTGPTGRRHTFYPTLDRCIEARQKSAQRSKGGHQYISLEAATELITRATIAVYDNNENENTNAKEEVDDDDFVTIATPSSIIGYKFRHDTRLLWPSLQYLSSDQIDYIMKEVEAPVCILSAEDGYPFEKDRIDRAIQNLKPKIYKTLPGSHHLHADPDTADAVVDTIYDFLKES
jgi:pimeloyl-ACP methyl ester carboxylesterase